MKQPLPTLLLLSFLLTSLQAQISITTESGNRYQYKVSPPAIQAMDNLKGSQKAEWGYYWEFGDGHFSSDASPTHSYDAQGSYEVRVYLTPQYAKNKPVMYQKAHQAAKGSPGKVDYTGSKNVDIHYNQEVVAGNEVQMVVAYEVPANAGEVYLLLGYNDLEGGSITANAFAPVGSHRPPKLAGKVNPAAVYGAPLAGNKSNIQGQLSRYNDVMAFKLTGSKAGDQRGIAVSLKATTSLRAQSNKNINVQLKALLVTTGVAFEARRFASEVKIRVTNSYDPNKLIVYDKTTEFDPKSPTPIDYLVQFENVGQGDAQRIQIGINVDEGLDPKSLKILGGEPCFTCIDTAIRADSIFFIMEGVRLAGRGSTGLFNKSQRRGQIRFQLSPRGDRRDVVRSQASIVFDLNDPIKTGKVGTRVRRNGIGVKAGLGLRPNFFVNNGSVFGEEAGGLLSFWHLGVIFSSSPVRTGLAWEFEMTYNAFNDTFLDDIQEESVVLRSTSEYTDLCQQNGLLRMSNPSFIDLVSQVRYHRNGAMGIGVGLGPSLLFNSRIDADPVFQPGESGTVSSRNALNYGLITVPKVNDAFEVLIDRTNGPQATCSYDHSELPHSNIGAVFVVDARAGRVNQGLSVGMRFTQRVHFGELVGARRVSANYLQTYVIWKL